MKPDSNTTEHDVCTIAELQSEFNQLRAKVSHLEVTLSYVHALLGIGYPVLGTSYIEVAATLVNIEHLITSMQVSCSSAYDLTQVFGSVTRGYIKLVHLHTGVENCWTLFTEGSRVLVQLVQNSPNPMTQTLYPYAVAARNNCIAHVMDYLAYDCHLADLPKVELPGKDVNDAILALLPTVSNYVKLA